MAVYIDLTEFFSRPRRTGIQRVCGQLCRHWPYDVELQPAVVTRDSRLVAVPLAAMGLIHRYFDAQGEVRTVEEEIREQCALLEGCGSSIKLTAADRILVPELFYDDSRFGYYQSLNPGAAAAVHFLVHDLFPLTHPQYFPRSISHEVIGRYFRLVRDVGTPGFVSRQTKQDFFQRLRRSGDSTAPVFHEGSDGLGPRSNDSGRDDGPPLFLVVGTVEPRKNHDAVLDALEDELCAAKPAFRLVFAGHVEFTGANTAARIRFLAAATPALNFVEDPDDETLRNLLQKARATIFVSSAEGFGLPGVESLWFGVPVIAAPGIPSLEGLGDQGVHTVRPPTPENIRGAVELFLDDEYHQRKAEEARRLQLPTWKSFTEEVVRWVTGRGMQPSRVSRTARARLLGLPDQMVSYAQNHEDVMLARVFEKEKDGFYVDVGAMDPVLGSITKYFYDRGWRGINIEPDYRYYQKLVRDRARDINLNVAVGDRRERRKLYRFQLEGVSTFNEHYRHLLEARGLRSAATEVEVTTLNQILKEHGGGPIDFLNIDAEGWEEHILHGIDLARYRPVVLVIEAIQPFSHTPAWQHWEPLVLEAGYILVYEDGVNRFYLREEDLNLREAFRYPPNALDNYVPYSTVRAADHVSETESRTSEGSHVSTARTVLNNSTHSKD